MRKGFKIAGVCVIIFAIFGYWHMWEQSLADEPLSPQMEGELRQAMKQIDRRLSNMPVTLIAVDEAAQAEIAALNAEAARKAAAEDAVKAYSKLQIAADNASKKFDDMRQKAEAATEARIKAAAATQTLERIAR